MKPLLSELGENLLRVLLARCRRVGIPDRHLENLNALELSGPWGDCVNRIQAMKKGYIVALLGPRGGGKTQIGVTLAAQLIAADLNNPRCVDESKICRYVKAANMFASIRDRAIGGTETTEMAVIESFTRPQLLIIDELGERAFSDFESRTLTNVIDTRYDALRDTILIANFGKQKFAESVGLSISSRIVETGEAIVCDWPSFRQKPVEVAL